MKVFFYLILFLIVADNSLPQTTYTDILIENSVYSEAPAEIQQTKPFIRQRWFFEQRAYPNNFIPQDAYANAMIQRDELRIQNADRIPAINWVSLGPTPGYYFSYGNISSRVVTGAYHPTNPSTIYIGPANGGVWKSTDSGVNWTPLTDDQPSMSMGATAIDPTNPNIIYAGTGEATYSGASYYGRGLLKSTDAGATWQHITSGLPSSSYFSRIKIRPNHPNEILAALGSSGLYRSTNYGVNWTTLVGGRCDDVVFTFTGDTAFAVGSGIGFRRSVDGGQTFNAFGTGLGTGTRTHFDLCLSQPAFMYASVHVSGNVNLYKSTNFGANWAQLTTTTAFQNQGGQAWYDLYCRVNPVNPNLVYVGTIDIWRTTDGTTFNNITNGYSGGYVHVDQHFLFFHPTDPNTIMSCNDGGIWLSTNSGTTFTNLNQNLTLTQFYRIAASPFTPSRILGGTQDNGTQQTYSALNWAAAYGGDGGEVCFNPFNSNFILGETQNGGIFRTTNGGTTWNSATSGITTSENVAWVAPIIAHPTVDGTFYTARQRVYRSTNNGGAWTAVSPNVNGSSAVREMAISKSNPSVLYATTGSNIFLSTDGGANFTNKTSGLPGRTITSVNIHPADENIALLTFSGFGTNKVYKTTNMGTTWFSINGNLPDSPVNDGFIYTYDALNPNTYFVATDIGVFLTQDNGTSWVELPNNLPNTVIMHLDYSPSNQMMRAGTHGRGVYEAFIDLNVPVELLSFTAETGVNTITLNWTTATETNNLGFEIERKLKNQEWLTVAFVEGKGTTTEIQNYSYIDDYSSLPYEGTVLYRLKQIDYNGSFEYSEQVAVNLTFIPSDYYISQNYPNPFNPSTTIKYSLPVESQVKINIYNALGETIEELVSLMQSPGNYEVTWNAQNYSSGIYYYSFEVNSTDGSQSHREMKKIVFLK
ncbi:MAG: T9SS type A sorting domain-containing protein [Ignavibacteriaceae bacterium]|nr:T9SS type A sorting domain-containing protein [Ignavibacteriaceae bacterium]